MAFWPHCPGGSTIDAESEAGTVDWRTDYDNLRYTVVDVPQGVRDYVRGLLNLLRLRFAALDFVITPSGEWVFRVQPEWPVRMVAGRHRCTLAAAIADALAKD